MVLPKYTRFFTLRHVIVLICLTALMPEPALAYLDSGTVNSLFQIGFALLVSAVVFIQLQWQNLKAVLTEWFFQKKR